MRIRRLLIATMLFTSTGCLLSTSSDIQPGNASLLVQVVTSSGRRYGQAIVDVSCAGGKVKTTVATDTSGTASIALVAPPDVVQHTGPWIDCDFEVTSVNLISLDNTRQVYFTPPRQLEPLQQLSVFGP